MSEALLRVFKRLTAGRCVAQERERGPLIRLSVLSPLEIVDEILTQMLNEAHRQGLIEATARG
jgi:hypothetical protein